MLIMYLYKITMRTCIYWVLSDLKMKLSIATPYSLEQWMVIFYSSCIRACVPHQTVCGHCHYAYYGKKVSKAAAKGQRRDYAYYRCIGTDAYRFGGERICDNQQIRTDRLDELVWQQVVELLAHPGRLKSVWKVRTPSSPG